MEKWYPIKDAPNYEVSTERQVRNVKFGRILRSNAGQVHIPINGVLGVHGVSRLLDIARWEDQHGFEFDDYSDEVYDE